MGTRLPAVVVWMGLLAACHGEQHSPSVSSVPTSPSVPTPGGFTLSGVVFEGTPSGLRPVPGGTVSFWPGSTVRRSRTSRHERSLRHFGPEPGTFCSGHVDSHAGGWRAAVTPAMPVQRHDHERHRVGHRGCSAGFSRVHLWFANFIRYRFRNDPRRSKASGGHAGFVLDQQLAWVRCVHPNQRRRAIPILSNPTRCGENRGRRLQRFGFRHGG